MAFVAHTNLNSEIPFIEESIKGLLQQDGYMGNVKVESNALFSNGSTSFADGAKTYKLTYVQADGTVLENNYAISQSDYLKVGNIDLIKAMIKVIATEWLVYLKNHIPFYGGVLKTIEANINI